MNAKDLRIGNWVYPKYSENEFKVDAEAINKCSVGIWYLQPIPLTEQWLIDFGASKHGEWYIIKDHGVQLINISITHKKTTFGWNEEYEIEHVKCVHQLQNLYHALTNEELVLNG